MHHILSGGKRIGDYATIALCPGHHRGIPSYGNVGPSMATSPSAFKMRYGDQMTLLALTDELLDIYRDGLENAFGNADALVEVSARIEQYAVNGVLPDVC